MQNLIALGIVGITAVWLIRHFARVAKSGSCGSAGATGNKSQKKPGTSDRKLKRTPLVPPDQIGLPSSTEESGTKE